MFDFAAVSFGLHVPFNLVTARLLRLANWLADPAELVHKARDVLQPLHRQLLPAIQNPLWQDDMSEEYFVFQLRPTNGGPAPVSALQRHPAWLAGLVRLESGEF